MTASCVPPRPTLLNHYEDRYHQAIGIAVYYQNQCCNLEEIIEMFCLDAAQKGTNDKPNPTPTNNHHERRASHAKRTGGC